MQYRPILLSTLSLFMIGHTPSTIAMNKQQKEQKIRLEQKRIDMRKKRSNRPQNNHPGTIINQQITQANKQASLTIQTKQQPLLSQSLSFLEACTHGHMKKVSDFIAHGGNVNTKDSREVTGLHFSSHHDQLETAQFLFEKGANINAEDHEIMTPLHYACIGGHFRVADFLIKNGANVHAVDIKKRTPMHLACSHGHYEIATLLNDNNADVNAKNYQNCTPLHFACHSGHLNVVELLVNRGAIINTQTARKFTPLQAACQKNENFFTIVKFLIAKGALINTKNCSNTTPLHTACHGGNINTVKLLIDNGADIYAVDDQGFSSIDFALQDNHADIIGFLKNIIYQPTIIKNKQLTLMQAILAQSLFNAFYNKTSNEIALVLQSLPDSSINDIKEEKHKSGLLHYACYFRYLPIVKLLIEKGAEINTTNPNLLTPLHLACEKENNTAVINLLLKHNADLEARSSQGGTPLHSACEYGNIKNIDYLLKRGANRHATTNIKMTPLHIACQNGHLDAVNLLLTSNAHINSANHQKMTPLHIAAIRGHVDIIKCLLEAGANVTTESIHGITALDFAYEMEKPAIIKLFAQYGAHVVSEEQSEKHAQDFFTRLNQTKPESNVQKNSQKNVETQEPIPTVAAPAQDIQIQTMDNGQATLSEQTIKSITPSPTNTEVTTANRSVAITKKTPKKSLKQQQQNIISPEKKKTSNTAQATAPTDANSCYQIIRPKKWPRHLVRNTQIKTMYEYFEGLKQWPNVKGLDIETLQGKLRGKLCMRVGGSRVIFEVDTVNRRIIIDEIALHHDGYKK